MAPRWRPYIFLTGTKRDMKLFLPDDATFNSLLAAAPRAVIVVSPRNSFYARVPT